MKILLLGAMGLAGAHFRRAAEADGMEVIGAARQGAEIGCDLLDPTSVMEAVSAASPAAVVNLAGAASVAASFQAPAETFAVNATGALNVLDAVARNAPNAFVLCVSSGDVYGVVEEAKLPVGEDEPLAPVSPYGSSKAALEVLCGQYARSAGLEIAVLRAFNHTGPGQSDRFAASSFARQIAEAERDGADEVMLETGDLSLARDFTDVRDVVLGYRMVVEKRIAGTFNACSGRPTRVGELVEHLDAATPLTVRTEAQPERMRPGEARALYGSPRRLEEACGWSARIELARTMVDLLEWWREMVRR
jgi:GDP-4-dehydro-6-deoxy-D-mannose reductase